MKEPKDSHRFLGSEVKRWKRAAFISQFEHRFENAADIYDFFNPKKKKKDKVED